MIESLFTSEILTLSIFIYFIVEFFKYIFSFTKLNKNQVYDSLLPFVPIIVGLMLSHKDMESMGKGVIAGAISGFVFKKLKALAE